MIGPRQRISRASCNSVEIRLRVNEDCAWIVIRRPGTEPTYRDIPDAKVGETVAAFQAIEGDPERFKAFLSRVA
jgi:hypothetical protein